MGVFLGGVSSLLYGVGDFLGGEGAKRVTAATVVLWAGAFSVPLIAAFAHRWRCESVGSMARCRRRVRRCPGSRHALRRSGQGSGGRGSSCCCGPQRGVPTRGRGGRGRAAERAGMGRGGGRGAGHRALLMGGRSGGGANGWSLVWVCCRTRVWGLHHPDRSHLAGVRVAPSGPGPSRFDGRGGRPGRGGSLVGLLVSHLTTAHRRRKRPVRRVWQRGSSSRSPGRLAGPGEYRRLVLSGGDSAHGPADQLGASGPSVKSPGSL